MIDHECDHVTFHMLICIKAAMLRFPNLEILRLSLLSLLFTIRVNLLHPYPSLFLYGLLLSLWSFSILVNYYFQVSFNLKVILLVAKATPNTIPRLSAFENY